MSDGQQGGDVAERGIFAWLRRNSGTITALSAASIPLVLGFIGWQTNRTINDQNLDQEYVDLAIGILSTEMDPGDRCDSDNGELMEEFRTQFPGVLGDSRQTSSSSLPTTSVPSSAASRDDVEQWKRFLMEDNGVRALRGYALELLNSRGPEGVKLDDQQYRALLCGEATVNLPTSTGSAEPELPEDRSGIGDDEVARLEQQAFLSIEKEHPLEECVVNVSAPVSQLTTEGEVSSTLLPPGTYEALLLRKTDPPTEETDLPTDETDPPTAVRFVQIENTNWIRLGEDAEWSSESGSIEWCD